MKIQFDKKELMPGTKPGDLCICTDYHNSLYGSILIYAKYVKAEHPGSKGTNKLIDISNGIDWELSSESFSRLPNGSEITLIQE